MVRKDSALLLLLSKLGVKSAVEIYKRRAILRGSMGIFDKWYIYRDDT